MSDVEKYEAVIGMEVHVELQTASKLFCRCPAEHFQVPANEHVCPVCTSQPGSLPVVNERAVELTVMTGMALKLRDPAPQPVRAQELRVPRSAQGVPDLAVRAAAVHGRLGGDRRRRRRQAGRHRARPPRGGHRQARARVARQPRRLQPRRRAADGGRLRLVATLRGRGRRLPAEDPAAGALPRGLDR